MVAPRLLTTDLAPLRSSSPAHFKLRLSDLRRICFPTVTTIGRICHPRLTTPSVRVSLSWTRLQRHSKRERGPTTMSWKVLTRSRSETDRLIWLMLCKFTRSQLTKLFQSLEEMPTCTVQCSHLRRTANRSQKSSSYRHRIPSLRAMRRSRKPSQI